MTQPGACEPWAPQAALWAKLAPDGRPLRAEQLRAALDRYGIPAEGPEVEAMVRLYAAPDGAVSREAFRRAFDEAGLKDGGLLGRLW